MVDILDETVAIVDLEPRAVYQPEEDTSLADSIAASTDPLSLEEVIADQTERRKLRPIIIGILVLGLTAGSVLVIRGIKRGKPGGP